MARVDDVLHPFLQVDVASLNTSRFCQEVTPDHPVARVHHQHDVQLDLLLAVQEIAGRWYGMRLLRPKPP
jgi:hypothetical protein